MKEKFEQAIKDMFASIQIARLYTIGHLRFRQFLDSAFESISAILSQEEEMVIGLIGGELAYGKEIALELSTALAPTIALFREKGIERIRICRGVDKQELAAFIGIVVSSKAQTEQSIQKQIELDGINNISVGKLKAWLHPGRVPAQTGSPVDLYADSSDKVSKTLETVLRGETVDYLNVRFSLRTLMENLMGGSADLLKMSIVKSYDVTVFTHCLNVAILAMYVSSRMGFSKEDGIDIGVAAMFHDIGKLFISRKIIRKKDALSEEEFSQVKNHALLGAEILLKYVDAFGILPVVVAFEHHMRYDGSGYPKVTPLRLPHPASLIVSLCDVYDALAQRRSYKNDYPPNKIYEIMQKEVGRNFDPILFKSFFKIIGLWPVGTIVSLNNGNIACVRQVYDDDIERPQVEVISPASEKRKIDLRLVRGTLAIERALNPWAEGKDYLAQAV